MIRLHGTPWPYTLAISPGRFRVHPIPSPVIQPVAEGVSGETKLPEKRRFEIPFASASIFFKFQPKPLLPSSTDGGSRWRNPMMLNPCQDFSGISNRHFSTTFAPPSTLGAGGWRFMLSRAVIGGSPHI